MFRKTILAVAAVTAIGAAALIPATASAHGPHGGWHGGHHGGWHGGGFRHFGGPRVIVGGPAYAAYNPCIRSRWVPTPWGPQLRRFNVCH